MLRKLRVNLWNFFNFWELVKSSEMRRKKVSLSKLCNFSINWESLSTVFFSSLSLSLSSNKILLTLRPSRVGWSAHFLKTLFLKLEVEKVLQRMDGPTFPRETHFSFRNEQLKSFLLLSHLHLGPAINNLSSFNTSFHIVFIKLQFGNHCSTWAWCCPCTNWCLLLVSSVKYRISISQ